MSKHLIRLKNTCKQQSKQNFAE